jgi:alkanesulfonate monooxygenase SsuD/methylene tetrahydromethanopterin reductase-like flavin-dependent oxidoreductase (luciferase family)
MNVATGIPNTVPGVPGRLYLEWARTAEACGFSALGTIGRISYDCYEELMVLAAAAGVTHRIGLMTTVLLGPLRETALLAKQAATLDRLSNGRFRLGLGLGAREEDYRVTQATFDRRGEQLEEQVRLIQRIWAGEKIRGAERPIGPLPQRPSVILSGRVEAAVERAGRIAGGFISTPMPVKDMTHQYELVRRTWKSHQREGQPYLAASRYVALDPKLQDEAETNVRNYYGFGGADYVKRILDGMLRTPDQVRDAIAEVGDTGADELFLWPVTAHLEELHRLADARG